jgi:hypothetical protein
MYHEIYSKEELHAVKITHKKFESWHDRVAYAAVRTLRFFFDTFTGYIHESPKSKSNNENENRRPRRTMNEQQWLRRIIFLESIAGVPGMVAGMSRHMRSLRKLLLLFYYILSNKYLKVQCNVIVDGFILFYRKQKMNVCIY